MSRRAAWAAALAAGLLYAALGPRPPLVYDDAAYYGLARSLAEGSGYRTAWNPEPERPRFPPLYPLVLRAALPLETAWPGAASLPSLLSSAAALPVLAALGAGAPWGGAVALAYALAPETVAHSARVLSEPLFVLLCYLSLWAYARSGHGERRASLAAALALAVAAGCARTAGWTLPAALAATLALRGRRREAAAAAAFAGAALVPFLALTRTGTYLSLWSPLAAGSGFAASAAKNAGVLFGRDLVTYASGGWLAGVSYSASGLPWVLLKTGASLALAAVAVHGAARRWRREGPGAEACWLALYTALCLGWSVYRNEYRFFLPVWPLWLGFLLEGLDGLGGPRAWKALAAAALAAAAGRDAALAARPPGHPYGGFVEACAWLRAEGPDLPVYSHADAGVRLHSGRRAAPLPSRPPPPSVLVLPEPAAGKAPWLGGAGYRRAFLSSDGRWGAYLPGDPDPPGAGAPHPL